MSQAIDGGIADVTFGPFTLELLAGASAPYTVDFDTSRPGFDDHTRRGFFGGLLTLNAGGQHPYAYGLIQRDYNNEETAHNGAFTTHFDYNSFYLGLGSQGAISDKLSYGIEAAYEGGKTLSNSFVQTGTSVAPITHAPRSHQRLRTRCPA